MEIHLPLVDRLTPNPPYRNGNREKEADTLSSAVVRGEKGTVFKHNEGKNLSVEQNVLEARRERDILLTERLTVPRAGQEEMLPGPGRATVAHQEGTVYSIKYTD